MDEMDMITITRAQFRENVNYCLEEFADTKPDSISREAGDLLVFVCRGWAKGLGHVLFNDEEDEDGDHEGTV